jgi:hypothetical protein
MRTIHRRDPRSRSAATLVAVLVLLSVAAPGGIASAAPTNGDLIARATALERAGRLTAAYRVLGRLDKPTKALATHRSHVGGALSGLAAARALTRTGDNAGARELLDAERKQLDPVADRFVVVRVAQSAARSAQRAARAAERARAAADAQARATNAQAAALGRRGEWKDAAALYKAVATKAEATVSPPLRQAAVIGQIKAEQRVAENAPGPVRRFLDSVWDVLRDALKWAVIAIIPAVLFGLAALLRRARRARPKPGVTSLALSDLGSDAKDRNRRDFALRREMYDAVQDVRHGTVSARSDGIDERRDLDGTAAPLVRLGEGAGRFDSLTDAENPVQIGPVKVSPVQLVYFVTAYVARPGEFELKGALHADGSGARFAVERVKTSDPNTLLSRWTATATGADACTKVIQEVAAKYAVETGASYVSSDWRSYQCYREAVTVIATMDGGAEADRIKLLDSARAALIRALHHDGANLAARLRLGAVLRMMGRNGDAAAQFERLMNDARDPKLLSGVASEYVTRHPELYYIAAYNRAVSLSKLRSSRRFSARNELALLVAKLGDGEPPVLDETERDDLKRAFDARAWPANDPAEDRERYRALAYGAWGAALLATADDRDEGSPERVAALRTRRAKVLARLRSVKEELGRTEGSDASGAIRQAGAVLDNAIARILFLQGENKGARDAAEQALAVCPDLGDAHITLAEIATARRNRDIDWATEAERQLKLALDISPNDERAIYALGSLYKGLDQREDAKQQFLLLRSDWRAHDRLGEIFMSEGAYGPAVEHFAWSQSQHESSDYRARLLVGAVLELSGAPDGRMTKRDASVANDAATRVVDALEAGEKKNEWMIKLGRLKQATMQLSSNASRTGAGGNGLPAGTT